MRGNNNAERKEIKQKTKVKKHNKKRILQAKGEGPPSASAVNDRLLYWKLWRQVQGGREGGGGDHP